MYIRHLTLDIGIIPGSYGFKMQYSKISPKLSRLIILLHGEDGMMCPIHFIKGIIFKRLILVSETSSYRHVMIGLRAIETMLSEKDDRNQLVLCIKYRMNCKE